MNFEIDVVEEAAVAAVAADDFAAQDLQRTTI